MDAKPPRGGLLASLREMFATGLAILQTRVEILATELEEEKFRLSSLFRYAVATFFFLGLGVVFLAAFLTVLLWDSHRLLVLGVFSAVFLLSGFVSLALLLRQSRVKTRLFAASLDELAQDRNALQNKIHGNE